MVSQVRPLKQLSSTLKFDGEEYALARIVVAVRVAVVISIGVLLAIGPDPVRRHVAETVAVLAAAMVYAAVLLANPHLEVRRTRYSWGVTGFDSAFTLGLIALAQVLSLVGKPMASRRLPALRCHASRGQPLDTGEIANRVARRLGHPHCRISHQRG